MLYRKALVHLMRWCHWLLLGLFYKPFIIFGLQILFFLGGVAFIPITCLQVLDSCVVSV